MKDTLTVRDLKKMLDQVSESNLDTPITVWDNGERHYLDPMLDLSIEGVVEVNIQQNQ